MLHWKAFQTWDELVMPTFTSMGGGYLWVRPAEVPFLPCSKITCLFLRLKLPENQLKATVPSFPWTFERLEPIALVI
jgi:hypothetical protein